MKGITIAMMAAMSLPQHVTTAVSQVLEGHREVLEVEALQWLAKNLATLPGLAEALISSQLLLPSRNVNNLSSSNMIW